MRRTRRGAVIANLVERPVGSSGIHGVFGLEEPSNLPPLARLALDGWGSVEVFGGGSEGVLLS